MLFQALDMAVYKMGATGLPEPPPVLLQFASAIAAGVSGFFGIVIYNKALNSFIVHAGTPPERLATSAPRRLAKSATSRAGQPD